MQYYEEHKKGIIGTIIFHIIVLALLIFLGFFTPLPLPGEEGILINFGTSENGLGEREPSPALNNPEPTRQVQQEEKEVTPPPSRTTPPPPTPKQETAKEAIVTQDKEQTAAIEAAEKKKKEEAEKKQKQLEEDRKRQAEIQKERDRLAEIERQKREAELERQRLAEAERKKREEEQRKINEINSRTQGAFGNSGTGTGGQGSSDGKSQGVTFPGGNQGVPTGDPNAGNYGQGGSGSGNQGSGPSFSLEGWNAINLPSPNYPGNDDGKVVVRITVDKNGNVTGAQPGVTGSTTLKPKLLEVAKNAALKAKFKPKENAQPSQVGTITYTFILN